MLRLIRGRPCVGIVTNEFFDPSLGRMGGFGWAARASAECLEIHPELGYRPLLLAGKGELSGVQAQRSNGVAVLRYDKSRRYARALRSARTSLVLTIDYRPNFLPVLDALSNRLVVVWVRDPRTPEDHAKIATLELPSASTRPAGVPTFDLTSLASFVRRVETAGTRVVLTAAAPELATAKIPATFGLDVSHVALLPNPLEVVPDSAAKPARPSVVFLGRLDPIKRPWVFVELARRFPAVEFLVLGQAHFSGEGSWEPIAVPENVRLLGHVHGAEKNRLLSSAWLIVNTSIHEGLPISFLEALHCATPIVASHDPELVTSRFGRFVGRWDGSGLEALDAFGDAIEELLDDHELRLRLGDEGRTWARATHTRDHFASAFATLASGEG